MNTIQRTFIWGIGGLASLLLTTASSHATIITSGCANTNVSCTFTELYLGASITINDVLFDNWVENSNDGDPDPLDPAVVTVSGVDEVVDGSDPSKSTLGLSFLQLPPQSMQPKRIS